MKIEKDANYSKTFVFEKVVHSVDFIVAIDPYFFPRVWNDNTVRVTCRGRDIELVDKLAKDANANPEQGEKGEWQNTSR